MTAESELLGRATAFEEFLAREDCASHPLEFFTRFHFRGRIEPEEFRLAARQTLARHPLGTARLVRERGRFSWQDGDPEPDLLVLAPEETFDAERLDLSARSGIRIVLQQDGARGWFGFQIHHCVIDAQGSALLLHDFLMHYAHLVEGHSLKLVALEPELLRSRGGFGLTPGTLLRSLPRQLVGLIGIRRAFFRKIATLGRPGRSPEELPADFPAILTAELTAEQSARFLAVSKLRNVSENDLVLRDLYLALDEYLREQGLDPGRRWTRLAIPVDLRTIAQRRMPAANVISMVLVDRRAPLFEKPGQLLYSIRGELALIKQWRLALTMIGVFNLARKLPLLWLPIRRQSATVLATNLGRFAGPRSLRDAQGRLVIGELVIDRLELAAPIRRSCPAMFTFFRYGGKLATTLHYDSREIEAEQAKLLLEGLQERFRRTAAQSVPS